MFRTTYYNIESSAEAETAPERLLTHTVCIRFAEVRSQAEKSLDREISVPLQRKNERSRVRGGR